MPLDRTTPFTETCRTACAKRPRLLLALLTTLVFLPFIDKAFHIDDPLFIWAAQHIGKAPFDFYGFSINWYGTSASAALVNQNPPLFSYLLALWAIPFGWSEVSLHSACLCASIAVVLGTYELAILLDARPAIAALLVLCTPIFVVTGTTVMCDMLMVALWVWATYAWLRGCRQRSAAWLAVSALGVLLAVLSKYFAVCLIPLLVYYALATRTPIRLWLRWLLLVAAGIVAYQLWTKYLYGFGLLSDAGRVAKEGRDSIGYAPKYWVAGLSFLGGGCAWFILLRGGGLVKRWPWLLLTSVFYAFALCLLWGSNMSAFKIPAGWSGWVQLHFWLIIGAAGLAWLMVQLGSRFRHPDDAVLCLWIAGTVVFNVFINWSVNARYLLPLVPAVALTVGRVMARRPCPRLGTRWALASCAVSLALALIVAGADYRFAKATKSSVEQITHTYQAPPQTNWFQGHWGGQYYFEKAGWRALSYGATLYPGDIVATPTVGCNTLPWGNCPFQNIASTVTDLGSLQTVENGAGFYAAQLGILPFAIAKLELRYIIAIIQEPPATEPSP